MPDAPSLEELERRVRVNPASLAFAALAERYLRLGRHSDAIQVCRTGLERHSNYPGARVTLGRALLATEQLDEAEAEFERVLAAAPDNLAAIRGRADIHQRRTERFESSGEYPATPGALEDPGAARPSVQPVALSRPEPPSDAAPAVDAAGPARPPPPAPVPPEVGRLERFLQAILSTRQLRGNDS